MAENPRSGGILGSIEWLGNKLPDPIFLFISATVLVFAISALGASMNWTVQPVRPRVVMETLPGPDGGSIQQPKLDAGGLPMMELVDAGAPIRPRNLVSADGVYWLIANMVRNFLNFPPLGVVLVSMFGIGVAEKVGLFGAGMRYLATLVPGRILTPTVVFLGIMSNTASDAGYIILPPLAAALYLAYGRSPMAGIAAAFAGVSGGFSANLLIASTDALIAPLTERGARVLDANYTVLATSNWYFLAGSTVVLTLAGWFVTERIVEPRLSRSLTGEVPVEQASAPLTNQERRGLRFALLAAFATLGVVAASIFIPGAPLHGVMPAAAPQHGQIPAAQVQSAANFQPDHDGPIVRNTPGAAVIAPGHTLSDAEATDQTRGTFRASEAITVRGTFDPAPKPQPRWSVAVVPIILLVFLIPGLAYGVATGVIRSPSDVSRAFVHSMTLMAPIIAMAFFAAQFIESFRHSQLDAMLANAGGKALVAADLPKPLLLVGVILLVMIVNVLMSSMSAKWTALAMILVPMLMMAGISPELSQAAYRVGDSLTNIITPLNSYIIVILAVVQRYQKGAGIGNLIAMMLPYTAVFFVIWTAFLLLWVWVGIPLGPSAPLWYTPPH